MASLKCSTCRSSGTALAPLGPGGWLGSALADALGLFGLIGSDRLASGERTASKLCFADVSWGGTNISPGGNHVSHIGNPHSLMMKPMHHDTQGL